MGEQALERPGLEYSRHFTEEGKEVYSQFDYEKTDIDITDDSGKVTFRQKDVEYPSTWSPLARKIVSSKYFYGQKETDERENSLKDLVGRVSGTMAEWAQRDGYFADEASAEKFREELAYLHMDQRMAFNSPVWFNVGVHRIAGDGGETQKQAYIIGEDGEPTQIPVGKDRFYPQTSACFIQSVDDTMEDIMDLAVREALLFKYGSGTGTNLSSLRSSKERLSGGGKPSGPLAYWAFYDKVAGIVKSGGKTRRAAKMDILNVEHPDILEFIQSKEKEEEKIRLLIAGGVGPVEAQESVNYQNTNISVRVSDAFMDAVKRGDKWKTIPVHNQDMAEEMPEYDARELFREIAKSARACGDPGMQYHDTINDWHTTPNTAPINASNPCSEYMQVDNSSCNLASLNLMKFMTDGEFQIGDFSSAVKTTAIAQDLEFDNSSYPTAEIARNSHRLRNLGMGYANLGSLVMSLNLPYDSPEARATAAAITALQTGVVYETSAEMARDIGPFEEFEKNKKPMMRVMRKHRSALDEIDRSKLPSNLESVLDEAYKVWDRVVEKGNQHGFRNAQATVLAPTGTIGFFMDCDTLGIEPEIGLVQTKLLADGAGTLRRVNGMVGPVLSELGYDKTQIKDIEEYIAGHADVSKTPHLKQEHQESVAEMRKAKTKIDASVEELKEFGYNPTEIGDIIEYLDGFETMEGAPHISDAHLPIFDCSNKPAHATRSISPRGHIEMMAAVQPFLSGAISKTVNMPSESTEEDVENTYMYGHDAGLKSIALYVDGSKGVQVLSFRDKSKLEEEVKVQGPIREKLPNKRAGIIQKFEIANGNKGYLTVGMYEDGRPGELFLEMNKEGSTIGGLADWGATLFSMALQHGVPLEQLVKQSRHRKFAPNGLVWDAEGINTVSSIPDFVAQYMEQQFLESGEKAGEEIVAQDIQTPSNKSKNKKFSEPVGGGEPGGFCPVCGEQMHREGNCSEVCSSCGHKDNRGCGA